MDKDLKKILKTLGVEDGDYYINDDGRVKKKGILFDEDTGIYQTESGEFKKEGILFDENTGLKQNKHGEFKEEGILFDKDTGIYQDKNGNYKKKGILFDKKTGYYKDKHGNIKKEGFFGNSSHINTGNAKNKSRESIKLPNSTSSLIGYFIGFAIVITIALTFLTIAFFLSPVILLIWYLIKKRELQWVAVLGMIFSTYLIYDITTGGFLTGTILKMQRTGQEKYIALGYFVILATTLGFFIDKYTSNIVPVVENGNFFQQKNIKERRPFIAGFSVLLLAVFSIFQFVNFSDNDNYNSSNYNNLNTTTSSKIRFNSSMLVGNWNIQNENNSTYNFSDNASGNFINGKGQRFDFNWSIPNTYTLRIKLDSDNSVWNWNIEQSSHNRIVMFSKQHNIRRTMTKRGNYLTNGSLAIITDPDGFTNVRAGKGTNTNVIYKLKTNENFTVYPTNDKWWELKLNNGQTGYIFHNRVHIINNNLKGQFPIASNKVLNQNDLNRMSKRDLQIMRNEIFARYGYIFKSGGQMDRHFRKTNWYRPEYKNVDSKLTEIEKKNIELILKHENQALNINNSVGYTNGTNIIMRNGHSTQSKIIGSLKNSGEKIQILDNYYPNNSETLIKRSVNVRTNMGTNYDLERGKSVIVLSKQGGKVKIQFKDKELRNLTATINQSYLDNSVSSNWYKIKRNTGEIGWVFGKFVNITN